MKCFLVQGKGGQLCYVKVDPRLNTIEKLFDIKVIVVNAFMRLPLNNYYHTLNIETQKYMKIRRIYDDYNELLMYIPCEDPKSLQILQLSQTNSKYNEIRLDMVSDNQMVLYNIFDNMKY